LKTTLSEEQEEQRRWRLRPAYAALAPRIARQLALEFAPQEDIAAWQGRRLSRLAVSAADNSPYWGALFRGRGFDPKLLADLDALESLPVLSKQELIRHNSALRAQRLPPGERVFGWTSSSGTTGRPARVLHSVRSNFMFTLLSQRQHRWYRLDPMGKLASIRLPSQMPHQHGRALADGETGRRPAWRYSGTLCETGPYVYFGVTNPVERQLEWLAREKPQYLQSYSETLEHLVFACEGRWPAPSLRKLQAISEQLTASMRKRIEETVGASVEQSYGLNEIGVVGARCSAGNYHVYPDHSVVEIVDDDGRRCTPGVVGRIVVTPIVNAAMPLFRYDTGDLAVAAQGACPCGRTLPWFGNIVGRYSRIAYLPEGTLPQAGALRAALEALPPAITHNVRQFQIHQYRDRSFELRVLAAGPLAPAFEQRMRAAWTAATADAHPLRIVMVEAIARSPGGKFQDFTSDFMPRADHDHAPDIENNKNK
jgi:phenylacetate-CoA ligase